MGLFVLSDAVCPKLQRQETEKRASQQALRPGPEPPPWLCKASSYTWRLVSTCFSFRKGNEEEEVVATSTQALLLDSCGSARP